MYELSKRLHGERKCFTGSQFVLELSKLGRETEDGQSDQSGRSNNTPTTAALVNYDTPYALKLGQFLLKEGILICLCSYDRPDNTSDTMESTSSSRLQAINTSSHGGMSDHIPLINGHTHIRDDEIPLLNGHTPTSTSTRDDHTHLIDDHTPTRDDHTPSSTVSGFSTPESYDSRGRVPTPRPSQFRDSSQSYYRFTGIEDGQGPTDGSIFQRVEILSATPTVTRGENRMQISDFDQARFGTLFLILDVCQNRSKSDKMAKSFLLRNETVRISNQRAGNNISCSKIFRI